MQLTQAFHGSALPDGTYGGMPAGVLLMIEGKTIYHAGDTSLFGDMKLIGEMDPIDLALLPIGDNFTMSVRHGVKAVELLNPKLTIPMHYKTFDLIKADPDKFVRMITEKGFKGQVL